MTLNHAQTPTPAGAIGLLMLGGERKNNVTQEAVDRVQSFVDLLVKALKIEDDTEAEDLERRITATLALYPTVIRVLVARGSLDAIRDRDRAVHHPLGLRPPFVPSEVNAIYAAADLAKWGILHLLPRCASCQAYFLPIRKDQTTCSTRCSKRRYAKTDKNKEYRREYMRKYNKGEVGGDMDENPLSAAHSRSSDTRLRF